MLCLLFLLDLILLLIWSGGCWKVRQIVKMMSCLLYLIFYLFFFQLLSPISFSPDACIFNYSYSSLMQIHADSGMGKVGDGMSMKVWIITETATTEKTVTGKIYPYISFSQTMVFFFFFFFSVPEWASFLNKRN